MYGDHGTYDSGDVIDHQFDADDAGAVIVDGRNDAHDLVLQRQLEGLAVALHAASGH